LFIFPILFIHYLIRCDAAINAYAEKHEILMKMALFAISMHSVTLGFTKLNEYLILSYKGDG